MASTSEVAVINCDHGIKVRVYYALETVNSIGGTLALSQIRVIVQRMTISTSEIVDDRDFYANGILKVMGTDVYTFTLANRDGRIRFLPHEAEYTIKTSAVTVDIRVTSLPINIEFYLAGNREGSFFCSNVTGPTIQNYALIGSYKRTLLNVKRYNILFRSEKGYSVTAFRNSSVAGYDDEYLSNGGEILAGDVVTITALPELGYKILSKVNDNQFNKEIQLTISEDIRVTVEAEIQGCAYIDGEMYICMIDTGNTFEQFIPFADNVNAWDVLS